MPKPQVIIYEKSVYGKTLIYPANETAETFSNIAGTATFSTENIKRIQMLGFEVVRTFPPREA